MDRRVGEDMLSEEGVGRRMEGVEVEGKEGGGEKREVKENVLPLPSSLCTHIRPPKAATICRDIANPRPVPPCFRVAL